MKKFLSIILMLALVCVPAKVACADGASFKADKTTEEWCSELQQMCKEQYYWQEDVPNTAPFTVAAALSGGFYLLTTRPGMQLMNGVRAAVVNAVGQLGGVNL